MAKLEVIDTQERSLVDPVHARNPHLQYLMQAIPYAEDKLEWLQEFRKHATYGNISMQFTDHELYVISLTWPDRAPKDSNFMDYLLMFLEPYDAAQWEGLL